MATPNLPDGFHTKPLNDGTVEFRIVGGGKEVAACRLTGEQLSVVVGNLLNAAHAAFHNADKQLRASPNIYQQEPTQVERWAIGGTNRPNQQVLIIEVGDATIAFAVPPDKVRELARYLIVASHHPQSAIPFRNLLRQTYLDLAAGIRGARTVTTARIKVFMRHRATALSSLVSGSSLRPFRTIRIAPGLVPPKYNPIEKCIYCGSKVYSTKPGIRSAPLGAEHIVPESIGGNLELPEASCQKCEDTTGRLVEGDALGRTLKVLRIHLKLKKAGSRPHPKTLPLTVSVDGRDTTIPDVPVEDHPIAFMLPIYQPPEFAANATGFGKAIRGAMFANIKLDLKALWKKYQVGSFAPPYWDNAMLCRMLAKIAHSFAVAELGETAFQPLLLRLICDGNSTGMSLIGCSPEWEKIPRSSALHTLELGYQRDHSKTYVVASVRLFASYDSPVYRVVVGESLEGPFARNIRVFSNKISRMMPR
jgi:HNH endonuclease